MKVYIFTRQDVERMIEENSYPENTIHIEFSLPNDVQPDDYEYFDDRKLHSSGFGTKFYDVDVDELKEYGLTEDTYFTDSVFALSDTIKSACDEKRDIVCFDESGTNLSSACAAAILEFFYGNGISIFSDSRYTPNKLLYNKILKGLRKERDTFMNVDIYSRKAVEELLEKGFPEKTAVISFYDPPNIRTGAVTEPVDYQGKAERVFYVPIYDIDIEVLPDFGLIYDTYFPEVDRLAEFIVKARDDRFNIICQCEYGQSRSAACAAAILEYYFCKGISIFSDYRYYPNQLIYNKIKNALDKKTDAYCPAYKFKKLVYPTD